MTTVPATLQRRTDKAFLVTSGETEAWLPRSLVSHDPSANTFAMPAWLARDRGLA